MPGTELWASNFTELPSPEGGCPALASPPPWLAWTSNEIMTVEVKYSKKKGSAHSGRDYPYY